MVEKKLELGNVIAYDVSFEDYMNFYAEDHCEWVEGMVIKLSPIAEEHDSIFQFLIRLLRDYLDETGEAILHTAPFVMKIIPGAPGREPDLQIIVKERANIVHETMVAGPADIVIEIVSQESIDRDYKTKLAEYEAGAVREYWLLDPIFRKTSFYYLGDDGKYQLIKLEHDIFHSMVLPRFQLDTRLLWQKPLPVGKQILALVETMLKEHKR
jgi:Uma2 family endonuclease